MGGGRGRMGGRMGGMGMPLALGAGGGLLGGMLIGDAMGNDGGGCKPPTYIPVVLCGLMLKLYAVFLSFATDLNRPCQGILVLLSPPLFNIDLAGFCRWWRRL